MLKLRLAVANSDLENCTGDLFLCELELEQYIEFGVRRPAACVPCMVMPVKVPSFFRDQMNQNLTGALCAKACHGTNNTSIVRTDCSIIFPGLINSVKAVVWSSQDGSCMPSSFQSWVSDLRPSPCSLLIFTSN